MFLIGTVIVSWSSTEMVTLYHCLHLAFVQKCHITSIHPSIHPSRSSMSSNRGPLIMHACQNIFLWLIFQHPFNSSCSKVVSSVHQAQSLFGSRFALDRRRSGTLGLPLFFLGVPVNDTELLRLLLEALLPLTTGCRLVSGSTLAE